MKFSFPSSSFFPFDANPAIKSHPGISSLSVCFCIFGALRHSPSPITSITPPRTRAPSILRTSLYPEHSICSVASPLIITGQARTIISISSGGGLYCSPALYRPNSSFTRSTSGVEGMYRLSPNSLLTMSPISTPSACAVPPAARIGPQNSIDRNSVPSSLFSIFTSPIPSKGATRTASVSTARPTRKPVSIDFLTSAVNACIFFATSTAIWIDAVSLSTLANNLRRSSCIARGSWSGAGLR